MQLQNISKMRFAWFQYFQFFANTLWKDSSNTWPGKLSLIILSNDFNWNHLKVVLQKLLPHETGNQKTNSFLLIYYKNLVATSKLIMLDLFAFLHFERLAIQKLALQPIL